MTIWAPIFACLLVGVWGQETAKPATAGDAPASANTRFFPLPGLNQGVGGALGGVLSLFDPCSRCNFNDIRFARDCCQRGNAHCCRFSQGAAGPFLGQGGQFGGNPGQFGQFGQQFPGGQVGQFGGQPGQFGQFGQQFPGGQVGQFGGSPPGFGGQFVAQGPIVKGGRCPRPGLAGLIFGRSGATNGGEAATGTSGIPASGNEIILDGGNKPGREARREARREERKQRQKRQSDRDDFRNDRRNRRLNRMNRVNGRVIRQAPQPPSGSSGQQDTRFLNLPGLANPFCRDDCFNDGDCPGVRKCCQNEHSCRICEIPVPF